MIETTLTHDWQHDAWDLVARRTADRRTTDLIAYWAPFHDGAPVTCQWQLPPDDEDTVRHHPGLRLPHDMAQAIHRALDSQFAQHTDLAQVTRERDDAIARAQDLERDLAILQVRLNAVEALNAAHHDTLEAQAAHLDREAATVDRERAHVDLLIAPRTVHLPEPRVTDLGKIGDPWRIPEQGDGQ